MRVIHVRTKICFIAYPMLPKTALPNSPLATLETHGGTAFGEWQCLGKSRLDQAPPEGLEIHPVLVRQSEITGQAQGRVSADGLLLVDQPRSSPAAAPLGPASSVDSLPPVCHSQNHRNFAPRGQRNRTCESTRPAFTAFPSTLSSSVTGDPSYGLNSHLPLKDHEEMR